jgi:hypothetical protein
MVRWLWAVQPGDVNVRGKHWFWAQSLGSVIEAARILVKFYGLVTVRFWVKG